MPVKRVKSQLSGIRRSPPPPSRTVFLGIFDCARTPTQLLQKMGHHHHHHQAALHCNTFFEGVDEVGGEDTAVSVIYLLVIFF